MASLCCTAVFACNVPVFRYALEHWNPDAYRGVVFHRGPLSEADQKRLESIKSGGPDAPVNLSIRTIDLDASPEPAETTLAASLKGAALPQLVVQYPARHQLETVLWSGPLDEAGLKPLADSPARQELLKRLITGQTAVWLVIDSGDTAQDDAALLTLEDELKNLPTTLKLPVQTDAPEDAIGDGPELRVEFSVLRIPRNDPQEAALVSMLINSEADLAELNEPLVFPVFGRCRSLLPLVGAGITVENIRGSARFLAGACSCQVKEQNPGFDLLITANWAELVPWAKSPAAGGALAKAGSGEPELVPIATGAKPADAVNATRPPIAETAMATETSPAVESKAAIAEPAPSAMVAPAPPGRLPLAAGVIVLVAVILGFVLFRR